MSPESFSNVSKVYEVLYRVLHGPIIVYRAVDVILRYEKQYEISVLLVFCSHQVICINIYHTYHNTK